MNPQKIGNELGCKIYKSFYPDDHISFFFFVKYTEMKIIKIIFENKYIFSTFTSKF